MTLIDARYYGEYMRRARQKLKIDTVQAANLLKMTHKDFVMCERGRAVFPSEIIQRLMFAGFSLMAYKKGAGPRHGK